MAAIGEAVRRMEAAGYRLEADGGTLRVSPADKLNEAQRQWLARNKEELLATLRALADPNIREMVALFDAEVVAVHLVNTGVVAKDGECQQHPPVLIGLLGR